MPKISRVELHRSSEIPAPASEVWALLGDWAGMLRWWPTADQGAPPGPKLVKCDLVGEHGAVPRMRRMTLDNGVLIEERIFYQSDEARRIYYTKTEPAASQLSGYLASAYVDEIDGHTCMMHFSSWFDARAASSAAAVRFEAIYQAIFDGFRNYFSKTVNSRNQPTRALLRRARADGPKGCPASGSTASAKLRYSRLRAT